MSSLSPLDSAMLEDLLQMRHGYILNFTNKEFASFVTRTTKIDIEDEHKYPISLSKANRLRKFWNEESDFNVGKLCLELLSFAEKSIRCRSDWSEAKKKDLEQLKRSLMSLMLGKGNIELPNSRDADENELKAQIELAVNQGKPSIALDRLHTLATKILRSVCASNGISLQSEKGERYNVVQLVGMLGKKYEAEHTFQSQFTASAIKYSSSIFIKFNDVRNNESFAHDNKILNNHEASFVIKIMAETLMFISETEKRRQKTI